MSMIPEEDDNRNISINLMEEEEIEVSKIDYTHITKHAYLNKVFCWIGTYFFNVESGNTSEVKRFFETFPHLLEDFHSPNNWNPFLYAVRYGNIELIDYFKQKCMKTKTSGILSSYSIVHTAVYSGEPHILEYVLNNLDVSVNPLECETSPLKIAMKANNPKMVEILAAKGAYYVFGDVYNNLVQKTNADEQNKYCSLQNKEIPHSMVVEETIIRDCPIKETLKFSRVKSIMALKLYSKEYSKSEHEGHKFHGLAKILAKEEYINLLLKIAVNKGNSILQKTNINETGEQIG